MKVPVTLKKFSHSVAKLLLHKPWTIAWLHWKAEKSSLPAQISKSGLLCESSIISLESAEMLTSFFSRNETPLFSSSGESYLFFQGSAPTHKKAKIEIRWLNNGKQLIIFSFLCCLIFPLLLYTLLHEKQPSWFLCTSFTFSLCVFRTPLSAVSWWEKMTNTYPTHEVTLRCYSYCYVCVSSVKSLSVLY